MTRHYDFSGRSGKTYRYMLHDEPEFPWPGGGNALFVRMRDGVAEVLHAVESENLARTLGEDLIETYQGDDIQVFIRLNVLRSARSNELADILAEDFKSR